MIRQPLARAGATLWARHLMSVSERGWKYENMPRDIEGILGGMVQLSAKSASSLLHSFRIFRTHVHSTTRYLVGTFISDVYTPYILLNAGTPNPELDSRAGRRALTRHRSPPCSYLQRHEQKVDIRMYHHA